MSRLPRILAEGRCIRILAVALLALGQAVAAGTAAFATRDVFAAFRSAPPDVPVQPLVLIAAAGGCIALLRVMERVVAEQVGQSYALALRLRLFDHLTRMAASEVARRRIGALSMRFVGDLAAVRNWVSRGIARLISAGIVLPASGLILYLIEPTLAAAAALPIGAGLLLMMLAALPLGQTHRRLRSRRAKLAADMSERLPVAPELRLLGRSGIERDRLQQHSERLRQSAVAHTRVAELLRAIPGAASGLAAASVLFVAYRGGLAPADAAAALAAIGLMIQPMRDLAGVWDRRRAWIVARDKCLTLLARPRLRRSRNGGARERLAGPQPVEFRDVSSGVLSCFSATAAAAEKIAIVGENGSGKSTLLHLAAGLEDCQHGQVRLGDRSVSELTASMRRQAIALVSARAPILAGSLRRALVMGVPERPTDAQIGVVAERFGLAAVVERLGGLDGTLAEGGRNLSVGEARRLVLVRAALSKPSLLLLDEPEAGLDPDGLALVAELVRTCNATVLMATHSPAIASEADRIWCLNDGSLVEAGTPDELRRAGGRTARFLSASISAGSSGRRVVSRRVVAGNAEGLEGGVSPA